MREALVVAHGDGPARVLVAYCLCADGAAFSADALRAALRRQLPEHMVPAAYVGLSAWPLTANGKIDRRALPAPAGRQSLRAAPVGGMSTVRALAEALRLLEGEAADFGRACSACRASAYTTISSQWADTR